MHTCIICVYASGAHVNPRGHALISSWTALMEASSEQFIVAIFSFKNVWAGWCSGRPALYFKVVRDNLQKHAHTHSARRARTHTHTHRAGSWRAAIPFSLSCWSPHTYIKTYINIHTRCTHTKTHTQDAPTFSEAPRAAKALAIWCQWCMHGSQRRAADTPNMHTHTHTPPRCTYVFGSSSCCKSSCNSASAMHAWISEACCRHTHTHTHTHAYTHANTHTSCVRDFNNELAHTNTPADRKSTRLNSSHRT